MRGHFENNLFEKTLLNLVMWQMRKMINVGSKLLSIETTELDIVIGW
jgi:hypothetical protein